MRSIMVLLLVITLAGCASSGQRMDAQTLSRIVPGATTKDQMIQMFGTPIAQSYGVEGKLSMIWAYVHVGPFATNIKQQNLAVLFSQDNRVERFSLVDNVNSAAVELAPPATLHASAPAAPLTEQSYKDAQVQQLMQKNLPYEEYQRQYRAIMAE